MSELVFSQCKADAQRLSHLSPQLIPVPSALLHLQEVEPRREQHECRGLCEDPHDAAHVSVRGTLSPAPSDVIILEKE